MHDATTTFALLALTVAAVGWDLRTRRIPNMLTASGFLVALVLRAFHGSDALAAGFLAAVLAFALAVPLVLAGGLGAGDAKLLAAVGAFVGPAALPIVLLVTALVGGLLAVAVATRRGAMGETLRHARVLLTRPTPDVQRRTLATPGALAVPYAVAISTGALAGWWV
jgi:prepilin peptidase CpaA